jgi:iron complex transport system substrate-binding protein
MTIEELASIAVDCGLQVHRELGPGLLETAYEKVLAHRLRQRGLTVTTQVTIPITVDGLVIDQGLRLDVLVEDRLIIEVKSVDRLAPVHAKQVLTYLRFLNLPLGLLMNFSGDKFSEGLKRIVNNHRDTTGSNLRLHQ